MRKSMQSILEEKWKRIGAMLLFLVCGLLAYSPAFHAGLFFDDHDVLFTGPKFFSLSQVWQHLLAMERPVLLLSYALDYRWSGFSPVGYHATNVAIHLATSFLAGNLFFRLLHDVVGYEKKSSMVWSVFAAFGFLLHPLQTEAVTYVAGRSASLCAFFYLLSVFFFLNAMRDFEAATAKRRAWRVGIWTGLSLFSFLLSLATKEDGATVPLALVLISWTKRKKMAPLWIPFFLVLALGLWKKAALVRGLFNAGDAVSYFFTQPGVIARYLRLFVFPWGQNVDHDIPRILSSGSPAFWLPLGVLVAAFGGLLFLAKSQGLEVGRSQRGKKPSGNSLRAGLFFLGFSWFLTTLLPSSSFIPIDDLMAERRMYLPSFGLWLMVLGVLVEIKKDVWPRVAMTVLLVIFLGLTFSRNRLYGDGIRFWEEVTERSPKKIRGWINLGSTFLEMGRSQEAEVILSRALTMDPKHPAILSNLGKLAWQRGDLANARAYYQRALALSPRDALLRYNDAQMRLEAGEIDSAMATFQSLTNDEPDLVYGFFGLGLAFQKKGDIPTATNLYGSALERDPCYPDALTNLGAIAFERGDYRQALSFFERGLRCDSEQDVMLLNAGIALLSLGDFPRAKAYLLRYQKKNPRHFMGNFQLLQIAVREGAGKERDYWLEQTKQAAKMPADIAMLRRFLGAVSP